jgi:hypothetical protein
MLQEAYRQEAAAEARDAAAAAAAGQGATAELQQEGAGEAQKLEAATERKRGAAEQPQDDGSSSEISRKLLSYAEPLSLPARVPNLDPLADDAFGTIMAWLHSRIEATR